jgi:hypothetical protein
VTADGLASQAVRCEAVVIAIVRPTGTAY